MDESPVAKRRRIALIVSERRRHLNLTLGELAERAGSTRDAVQLLESEISLPRAEDLEGIARALGFDPAILDGRAFAPNSHHIVLDRDTGSATVAYFTGSHWSLPGSTLEFPASTFGRDGSRFTVIEPVPMPAGLKPWSATNGTFV